jgi:hypothetical protein
MFLGRRVGAPSGTADYYRRRLSIKESIQLTRVEVFGDVFTDEKRVEILGWSRRFRQIRHFLTVVRHEYL